MALRDGDQVGTYVIQGALGVGAMGEVYRARDTKLNRPVAIKVLLPQVANDPDRLSRFTREAQVLASLNHPHIAQIYGLEELAGVRAIVMELVEGPTLAERLRRGAVPIAQALPMAIDIAEALEAAHERGIVHRDLKPANIKIAAGGGVKVLDFGLAKTVAADDGSGVSESLTPTVQGTAEGMILGTAPYMSPEQARGHAVDKRADIWSFGCVLYEMLTGRRAYEGATISDTLAAILEREPNWRALPDETTPNIRRVLKRCLEKDASRRLHDIADGRIELEDPSGPTTAGVVRGPRTYIPWLVAAGAVVAAGAALMLPSRPEAPALPELRFEINTPVTSDAFSFAISPDGRQLLYSATTESVTQLWLRPLARTTAELLPGTEGGSYPFWSPDSRAFAFFADGRLKRFDLSGGQSRALADAPSGRGGAWSTDGVILFAPAATGPLFRVAASGGAVTAITQPDPIQPSHRFPYFLPGGRRFVFLVGSGPTETEGIYLGSLDDAETKRLVAAESGAAFAPPDYVLIGRPGVVLAARIDVMRGEVGEAFPIAEPTGRDLFGRGPSFSVSTTGVLAYRVAVARRQLVWVDRRGVDVESLGQPEEVNLLDPAPAPDGQQIALARTVRGNFDVWIQEVTRSVTRRFTFDPAIDSAPVWSPDGTRLAFTSARSGPLDLYEKPLNGADPERLLLASAHNKIPMDWSPDGTVLLYQASDPTTGWDVWALPLAGDPKPFPVAQTPATERSAQFSPDGQWVAYDSNESSGPFEVFVQSFPKPGARRQISTGGGAAPRWRRDGRELFYLAPDGTLTAVPVQVSADRRTLEPGPPVRLFRKAIVGGGTPPDNLRQQYVVAPDGKRFLLNTPTNEASASPIRIVQNWMAAVSR